MKPRIPANILVAIDARRYGTYSRSMRNPYCYNNRLMRNLVASPDRYFKPSGKIRSSRSFHRGLPQYSSHDKLYSENNRQCYALRGQRGEPTLMYTISSDSYPGRWRYESHMTITRSGMTNPNRPETDLRLLLASNSLLEIRNESNGEMIDVIDLKAHDLPSMKFSTLRWDPNQDQVTAVSQKATIDGKKSLWHIVILQICPRVSKSLRVPIREEIFGKDIVNVVLFDGILQVMYRNETVHLYDFEWICETNDIASMFGERILEISDLGTPVFVVKNTTDMLSFGGHPWHYITHSHRLGEYAVCTLDHQKLVSFPINEHDTVCFHPDDSGDIAHFQKDVVTIHKYFYDERKKKPTLKKLHEMRLEMSPRREQEGDMPPRPGRYGTRRAPRRSASWVESHREGLGERYRLADEEGRVLFSDDYENELNLMLLMGTDSGDPQERGMIQIFDNGTRERVRTIMFDRPLAESTEYFVTLDLDVLIVFATRQGSSSCEAQVYRLLHR
ncbi:DDB1- and CUL4-associated factor 17-like [Galendromus occidentalis]|uniref:DDB1- and CUL4-associated factor 17-like n=1 Tax=Galendromus occidentalis TaxID=34638 RepID=A0AAJ7SGQ3_9ACAR|nr:DDB1- and CUL4-associated factor 17-like [Galendromus occidentalis]